MSVLVLDCEPRMHHQYVLVLSLIRSTPAFVKPLESSRMKVVKVLLTLASSA